MMTINRREALGVSAVAALAPTAVGAQADGSAAFQEVATWAAERRRVMEIGFTEDEALCWEYVARAAAEFFELPVLGELDAHEVAEAAHVIQNKLLSRPTYHRYVELAKEQSRAQR